MLIQCYITILAAIFSILGPSCMCRRVNPRRLYKEYKDVLKAANMTSFPEGDIRNLVIDSHEFSKNKDRKLVHPQPEVTTKVIKTHIASTNMATISRKKGGRRGRNRSDNSKTHVSPGSLWQKKLFAMRREETERLLREESNEIESRPTKNKSTPTKVKGTLRKDRRKQRRKYNRRLLSGRPIKGTTAVSLDIARLKPRCKTRPMKQEIRVEGCLSKSIMNNLCYGQCNSFYIPEIRGKGNGPPSFTSCAFCRPGTVRTVYVTLRCTSKRGRARLKRRKVSYIKKCRCMEMDVGKVL